MYQISLLAVDMAVEPASKLEMTSSLSVISPLAITDILVSWIILLITLGIIPGKISMAEGLKLLIEFIEFLKAMES